MKYFNIDEALKLSQVFDVMHQALDELYAKREEAFQKDNPLRRIYKFVKLDSFQKSYGSSTGFKQAFEQTVDYASYPGFTNGDGFKATISYKPFNGAISFTWQTLLEGKTDAIAEELSNYQIAWQRQVVQYGMYALVAFFGGKIYDPVAKTYLKINSADTTDGDPMGDTKNPVFTNAHTIVKRDDVSLEEFNAAKQSNKYYINVKLDGTDPLAHAKIMDGLNQIKSRMNNSKDDNNQYAGLVGRKLIVAADEPRLNGTLNSILAADDFSAAVGKPTLNLVKNAFDTYYTPYLQGNSKQPIPQFATDATAGHARGFLVLDPEYNNANKGPMFVERVPFSIDSFKEKNPEALWYTGKQGFDIFCPSWRGIAYVYIGLPAGDATAWDDVSTFTEIVPIAYGLAVSLIGDDVRVRGVSIASTAAVTKAAGDNHTSQLTATITPSTASITELLWFSSNTAVATVSDAGLITGVETGTATITVVTKDGGFSDTCTVTVS